MQTRNLRACLWVFACLLAIILSVFLSQFRHYTRTEPTVDELNDISKACDKLWQLDTNRLVPGKDYRIQLTKSQLFSSVNPEALNKPTFKSFLHLLHNYHARTGITEYDEDAKEKQQRLFLEQVMDTPVMQYTHRYLLLKGRTTAVSREDFVNELQNIWFGPYSRKVYDDSSGFEHVFVGEIKNDEITGLHNWLQMYNEERHHRLNYRGFYDAQGPGVVRKAHLLTPALHRNSTNSDQLVTIQFQWNGVMKHVSSSFIGTSPEFELALYTLCFLDGVKDGETRIKLGPYNAAVTCYTWHTPEHIRIATTFPSLESRE